MSGRQRALPVWMGKKEKEKEPLRSTRKPKTARSAFYCMNEKELVDAAVSYLTEREDVERVLPRTVHEVVEDKAVDTSVNVRTNAATLQTTAKLVTVQEESSDGDDAPEKTYLSESDSDIVQVETKSPQPQGPRGQRSRPEEEEESSQTPAKKKKEEEEDDPLRLVREIFFT